MNRQKYFLILVAGSDSVSCRLYDLSAELVAKSQSAGRVDILAAIYKFLDKKKLSLADTRGLGLVADKAGLTSIKVWCTVINTLGWASGRAVSASFYPGDPDLAAKELVKKLAKIKKYSPIKPVYRYRPDIVVSKQPKKYKIV